MYIVYRTYSVHVGDIVHMGTRDLRDELGRRVDAAHFLGEVTVVTMNGEPRAVLVPYAEWKKWQAGESKPPPSSP